MKFGLFLVLHITSSHSAVINPDLRPVENALHEYDATDITDKQELGEVGVTTPTEVDNVRRATLEDDQKDPLFKTLISFKRKRCPNHRDGILGAIHNSNEPLLISRRDLRQSSNRKLCELCKNGSRCKKRGDCTLCDRVCKGYDNEIKREIPSSTEIDPAVGHIIQRENNDIGIDNEFMQDDRTIVSARLGDFQDPTAGSTNDRQSQFYTMGFLNAGPIMRTLLRLLQIENKNDVDQIIIIAKTKNHHVNKFVDNKNSASNSIFSKFLEQELGMATSAKMRATNNEDLTPEEVDKIIDHALKMTNIRNAQTETLTDDQRTEDTENNINDTVACKKDDSEYVPLYPINGGYYRSADGNEELKSEHTNTEYPQSLDGEESKINSIPAVPTSDFDKTPELKFTNLQNEQKGSKTPLNKEPLVRLSKPYTEGEKPMVEGTLLDHMDSNLMGRFDALKDEADPPKSLDQEPAIVEMRRDTNEDKSSENDNVGCSLEKSEILPLFPLPRPRPYRPYVPPTNEYNDAEYKESEKNPAVIEDSPDMALRNAPDRSKVSNGDKLGEVVTLLNKINSQLKASSHPDNVLGDPKRTDLEDPSESEIESGLKNAEETDEGENHNDNINQSSEMSAFKARTHKHKKHKYVPYGGGYSGGYYRDANVEAVAPTPEDELHNENINVGKEIPLAPVSAEADHSNVGQENPLAIVSDPNVDSKTRTHKHKKQKYMPHGGGYSGGYYRDANVEAVDPTPEEELQNGNANVGQESPVASVSAETVNSNLGDENLLAPGSAENIDSRARTHKHKKQKYMPHGGGYSGGYYREASLEAVTPTPEDELQNENINVGKKIPVSSVSAETDNSNLGDEHLLAPVSAENVDSKARTHKHKKQKYMPHGGGYSGGYYRDANVEAVDPTPQDELQNGNENVGKESPIASVSAETGNSNLGDEHLLAPGSAENVDSKARTHKHKKQKYMPHGGGYSGGYYRDANVEAVDPTPQDELQNGNANVGKESPVASVSAETVNSNLGDENLLASVSAENIDSKVRTHKHKKHKYVPYGGGYSGGYYRNADIGENENVEKENLLGRVSTESADPNVGLENPLAPGSTENVDTKTRTHKHKKQKPYGQGYYSGGYYRGADLEEETSLPQESGNTFKNEQNQHEESLNPVQQKTVGSQQLSSEKMENDVNHPSNLNPTEEYVGDVNQINNINSLDTQNLNIDHNLGISPHEGSDNFEFARKLTSATRRDQAQNLQQDRNLLGHDDVDQTISLQNHKRPVPESASLYANGDVAHMQNSQLNKKIEPETFISIAPKKTRFEGKAGSPLQPEATIQSSYEKIIDPPGGTNLAQDVIKFVDNPTKAVSNTIHKIIDFPKKYSAMNNDNSKFPFGIFDKHLANEKVFGLARNSKFLNSETSKLLDKQSIEVQNNIESINTADKVGAIQEIDTGVPLEDTIQESFNNFGNGEGMMTEQGIVGKSKSVYETIPSKHSKESDESNSSSDEERKVLNLPKRKPIGKFPTSKVVAKDSINKKSDSKLPPLEGIQQSSEVSINDKKFLKHITRHDGDDIKVQNDLVENKDSNGNGAEDPSQDSEIKHGKPVASTYQMTKSKLETPTNKYFTPKSQSASAYSDAKSHTIAIPIPEQGMKHDVKINGNFPNELPISQDNKLNNQLFAEESPQTESESNSESKKHNFNPEQNNLYGIENTEPRNEETVLGMQSRNKALSYPDIPNEITSKEQNVLNHFGKIVPNTPLNLKSDNVMFLGNGIKLPLHMSQNKDGSISLAVDVDKMCNCKNSTCPHNTDQESKIIQDNMFGIEKFGSNRDNLSSKDKFTEIIGQRETVEENDQDPAVLMASPNLDDSSEVENVGDEVQQLRQTKKNLESRLEDHKSDIENFEEHNEGSLGRNTVVKRSPKSNSQEIKEKKDFMRNRNNFHSNSEESKNSREKDSANTKGKRTEPQLTTKESKGSNLIAGETEQKKYSNQKENSINTNSRRKSKNNSLNNRISNKNINDHLNDNRIADGDDEKYDQLLGVNEIYKFKQIEHDLEHKLSELNENVEKSNKQHENMVQKSTNNIFKTDEDNKVVVKGVGIVKNVLKWMKDLTNQKISI